MVGLKALAGKDVAFHGIGGPLMRAEGLEPIFPMEELSVIGLTDHSRQLPPPGAARPRHRRRGAGAGPPMR